MFIYRLNYKMSDNSVKPTREELLQKLKNKKKQVELYRMTKKNRDTTLEKLENKAKVEKEEMMKQLKKCTPEQLKAFGLNDEMIAQLLKKDEPEENPHEPEIDLHQNDLHASHSSDNKKAIDNIFDIPDIHIPKMTVPVNSRIVNKQEVNNN